MTISIYDPRVKREAQEFGITELQAYRKLNARQSIINQQRRPVITYSPRNYDLILVTWKK